MVSKRCLSNFIPRRRCLTIFVVILYLVYFVWFRQHPINLTFLTAYLNLNCETRDYVCKECPEFFDKIHQLRTCFKKNLLNTKYEILPTEKDVYLPTKALNVIANLSDFCNEEFFFQQNDILQLVTINGPKIGEGYGTSLFIKSNTKELSCRTGFVGTYEDAIIERQLKTSMPACEIMALSQSLSNDTNLIVAEDLNSKITEAILTKPDSEKIANFETLANLIEVSFREQQPLDVLFIKYWFSLTDFLKFLQDIEISENPICQINARIKIDKDSFETGVKEFENLFDSDFYPLHIDVRGNELLIFLINVKRQFCVKKFFLFYCNNKGWIF